MNKISIIILAFLFIPFLQNTQEIENELEQVFNEYNLMGLSVWVSKENIDQIYNFGFRDINRNLEVNNATKFRIASISKIFTALGLLKLYDDGHFQLDDDISDALGYLVRNPQYPNIPITYRQLLSHQSSLQDGTGYQDFLNATFNNTPIPNISELILPDGDYYTSNMWRTESPGTYFTYSNLNYGLIGTLIEFHSKMRFDVFMKDQILIPLNISGSYNIQDVPDINDIAVIYRNQNGVWTPQVDHYNGIYPSPPDLSSYIIGDNGLFFSPQGGLRISTQEIGLCLDYLSLDSNAPIGISDFTLEEMKTIQWDYNGNNGDNYYGLFNRWSLGLHHANITTEDQICNLGIFESFLGHPGEAYGLIGDAFFLENENISFSLLINGNYNGYEFGDNSSFYKVEESIFEILCNYFIEELSVSENSLEKNISIWSNKKEQQLIVSLDDYKNNITYNIMDVKGSKLIDSTIQKQKDIKIDISSLNKGIYFILLNVNNKRSNTYKFIVD